MIKQHRSYSMIQSQGRRVMTQRWELLLPPQTIMGVKNRKTLASWGQYRITLRTRKAL